jgi:hypothetical protein
MVGRLAHKALQIGGQLPPNGLEMSRPARSWILHQTRFAAAGRVGSIELLGRPGKTRRRIIACPIVEALVSSGCLRMGTPRFAMPAAAL